MRIKGQRLDKAQPLPTCPATKCQRQLILPSSMGCSKSPRVILLMPGTSHKLFLSCGAYDQGEDEQEGAGHEATNAKAPRPTGSTLSDVLLARGKGPVA